MGSLFSKVQKQTNGRQFKVLTKSAALGVRGTEFFTAINEKKPGAADVWMCVHEGSVFVNDLADSKSVVVKKGEGVVIPAGKSVTTPKPYAWTKNLNWNMDPKAGKVLDETFIEPAYDDLLDKNYD